MKLLLTLLCWVVVCYFNTAQAIPTIQHNPNLTHSSSLWDTVDIQFHVNDLPRNAIDHQFDAQFTHESGITFQAHGFFNGGQEYLIRWCPQLQGKWNYVTRSSIPSLKELSGSLSITPPRPGRMGGIERDPKSTRKFQYQNGDSYYPIAFEADWLFALDAENDKDIPVTRQFVDQLAHYGFNQLILNVYAYDVSWKKDDTLISKYEYGSPKVFPFGGDNQSPDHSEINIEFFKRFDRVIAYLDEKDIAAHLMFYVWNKLVNWPKAGSQEDNRYFDYVAKRYQAFPNIVWDISKEALGYGHTDVHYITDRINRLRKLDSYKRLITVHDYSYCRRFTENVDFISVQLWGSELYSVMRKVWADMPGKPILNIEHGGYERSPYVVFTGNYTSPEVCLERAYQCVFAGTFPTHYWQGAAWNVIIPDFDSLPDDSRPKFEYYKHLATLVKKYDINSLKAGDKKSSSGFCLHNGNNFFLYYVPKENDHIGVRLPKNLEGTMTGTWFNPYSGHFDDPVKKKITQWPSFEKPKGKGFRILAIEVNESNTK